MAPKGLQRVNPQDGATQAMEIPRGNQKSKGNPSDYSSHGITDNDIFLLPASDLQLLGILTAVAAAIRLFRIYQPSSVVFDEVQ